MTLNVPPDLQYGLLEFIAHMNAEDYDALPEDFVKIGYPHIPIGFHDIRSRNILLLKITITFVKFTISAG